LCNANLYHMFSLLYTTLLSVTNNHTPLTPLTCSVSTSCLHKVSFKPYWCIYRAVLNCLLKPLSAMCKQLQNLSSIILSYSYSFPELFSLVYMKDPGNQPTMTNLRVWWSTIIHRIRVSHSAISKWCIVQLQMDNIMNRHFTSERCYFILPTYPQSSAVTTHGHAVILTDYWGQHNTTVP